MQTRRVSGRDRLAVLVALAAPLALAAALVPFRASIPNTDAALALLLVVVAVAANGYRLAGFLAALSAAAWFDFFLTRPYERFSINSRVDIETTVLLLVIGVAVTEIAVWGRRQHAAASRRAGYLDGINAAAHAVAAGDSPSALVDQVTRQLTQLLSLQSCRFQQGVAGLGQPARLREDGSVAVGSRAWDIDADGFPRGTDVELLVESGGVFQGRFLMTLVLLQVGWPAHPRRTSTLLVALDTGDSLALLSQWCDQQASVAPVRRQGAELQLRRRQSLERVHAVMVAEDTGRC